MDDEEELAMGRTLAGQLDELGIRAADLVAILRDRASSALDHLGRSCATALAHVQDVADARARERDEAMANDAAGVGERPFWFTFGGGHRLVSTGSNGTVYSDDTAYGLPLGKRFVVLSGRDWVHARARMRAMFGNRWGSQYETRVDAEIDRWELTELDVSDAIAELKRDGRWPA